MEEAKPTNIFLQVKEIITATTTTVTRPPNPTSPPVPDLSRDIPINPSTKTWLRIYRPPQLTPKKLPVILFFHGGGFFLFSASTAFYDSSCANIARSVPAIVLSVDYRLAPESRLPSAYDDALDALLWLSDEGAQDPWLQEQGDLSRCFIMGSSSGGNIVYHAARRVFSGVGLDLGPVKVVGLILNQPFFGGVERTESETEDDDVLPLRATDMMWRLSLPVGADRDHEYCNPSREEVATKGDEYLLPRCLVRGHVGDPLINRQRAFVKLLKGRTEGLVAKMEEEGCHAVEVFDPELAKKFVSDIRDFVVSS
ncbi:putative carboxylesterase 8 [Acorus gramineus]|uniref:Carboxylesterase 8 n=1 Tax=Acorus gramineus TaxID=55184 RepID=A0AAV9AQK9_ACOGR|nr:putative carboxylesterase 8 [Acorus gramineus]